MGDADPMYSSAQIGIPPTLPEILKRYTKAAIKTQPDDLLQWSALYFEALAEGRAPPVSNRVVTEPTSIKDIKDKAAEANAHDQQPQGSKGGGSAAAYANALPKLAHTTLKAGTSFPLDDIKEMCSSLGVPQDSVRSVLDVGEFADPVPGVPFTALLAGFLKPGLAETCKYLGTLCEQGLLPTDIFLEAFEFLAKVEGKPQTEIDAVAGSAHAHGRALSAAQIDELLAVADNSDKQQHGEEETEAKARAKKGESGQSPPQPSAPPLEESTGFAAELKTIEETKTAHPENRMAKHFDAEYFNSLDSEEQKGLVQCCRSGIENPDSSMGCYAMQPADYDRFKPFFSKVIADYHGVAEDAKHVNNWDLSSVDGLPEGGKLDLAALGLPGLGMRVRVGRNLADFPLPGAMTRDDRINLEKKMCEAFEKLKAMPDYGGRYNSLTPGHGDEISQEEYKQLVANHIMFKDMAADPYLASAGIASDWPYGRGCYVSEDCGFVIWVGEEDHLRIMCMQEGTVLNDVFGRLKLALDVVSEIEGLSFAMSPDYGVVTSCPTNLGTGMRASVHIGLPNLTADGTDAKAKEVCKPLGLSVRGIGGEHTPIGEGGVCDISPRARFCITEAEIICALYKGIKQLKEKEDEMASTSQA